MDVKIIAVQGQGDASEEAVWLKVENDCNLGEYLLADDTFNRNGLPSNKVRHVYFFPSKTAKKGEYVRLNTGIGRNKEYVAKESGTNRDVNVHLFYWNLKEPVWNDTGDCAHLLKAPASQRQQFPVPPKK